MLLDTHVYINCRYNSHFSIASVVVFKFQKIVVLIEITYIPANSIFDIFLFFSARDDNNNNIAS